MLKATNNPPNVVVIDNFYQNVDEIRQRALSAHKYPHGNWKGRRSDMIPLEEVEALRPIFERALGINLDHVHIRSHFHVHDKDTPVVYHQDYQRWAAVVYLVPNAPLNCGTSIWKRKYNNGHFQDGEGPVLDGRYWDNIDSVGNVYNRCIIFNGHLHHSVSGYFGETEEDRRLVQLFFFDPK